MTRTSSIARLAMPPDGKLSEAQIAALEQWIKTGAIWPGSTTTTQPAAPAALEPLPSLAPNARDLAKRGRHLADIEIRAARRHADGAAAGLARLWRQGLRAQS